MKRVVPALLPLIAGCNLITGADEFEIGGAGGTQSSNGGSLPNGASGPGPSTGPGPGSGGAGGDATTTTGTGDTTTSTTTSTSTGGPMCAVQCAANEHCDLATETCVCDPGFVDQGGSCSPVDPGDPSVRTSAEVCDQWAAGHVVTDPSPFSSSGAECDAGTLSQGGLDDTLTRINLYRWLSGLGPTFDDPGLNAIDQKCANLESWWNFGMPESPHSPPATSKCYTAEGAQGAGMSNIAWGNGPADSIDQFIEDNGNETTMGHRRWIVNPPLGPVGIGYWEGGGTYGRAECLAVFGSSGQGPFPAWVAVPNQGYVPLTVAQWTWTFHGNDSAIANATVSVVRVDDNTPLAVTIRTLSQGFGQYAISWVPSGWQAEAGKTYRVTIGSLSGGDITYDVKPISC
ncbi:MAG: CAP domain-containing protein [Polyangiaceae bacterium]